ncbi:MAG: HAD domain-containing protein [Janthinobacterium lividum]
MVVLLDLDGVLITTPPWRPLEIQADGFFKLNEKAAANLAGILTQTQAAVVLTTSHRINYSVEQWREILQTRGINPASITKINDCRTVADMADRATEIAEWVSRQPAELNYVVLDDDLSLHDLPAAIRQRCVLTKPLLGLDADATRQALTILRGPVRQEFGTALPPPATN